ncbi:MAG: caspase family protein, partial [Alphaproteobacteria bacterium]|nr:caspase family protein [Alphaproteobacteria bacterium]
MRLRFLAVLFLMALVLVLAPVHAAENSDAVAVVIGNKSYSGDRIPDVDYARRDADAFKRYLTDVLGYREGNIIDLRDATQAKMEAALGNERTHEGTIWQWIRPGESDVTVFYSGHGVPGLKSKRGYLLPVDADPNKPEINGFPVDTLYRNLSKLLARSVTVYLDACFSGDSPKGMLIESASGMTVTPRMPENTKGLVVLTAAQGGQVASWDKKNQHGLFTQYLLEALYGKADKEKYGNGDGKVTLKEVKNYLDREMTYAARREYGRIQQATVKGKKDMVLVAFDGGKPPERPQLGMVPIPAPKPAKPVEPMDDTLFAQKNANVRESTSAESRKIGTVPKGGEVQVTGKAGNWYRVALAGGGMGYVFGDLLKEAPSPVKPAVGIY